MATNGDNSVEDIEMDECNGEKVVTMVDVLKEQEEFEDDANAVLGASDEKNCTYSKGYVKRQALYACMTCCAEAKEDPFKRAGVCLACSLMCHENHELIELYTKRNFRCDCGNPKFNSHPCQFTTIKTDLNEDNKYNQNFSGLYCTCHRPYPDPESNNDDDMIQCTICEDWYHATHLEAVVPANDQFSEMVCKECMEKNYFLHDYSHLAVGTENADVDVTDISCSSVEFSLPNGGVNSEVTDLLTDIEMTENLINETTLNKDEVGIKTTSKEPSDIDNKIEEQINIATIESVQSINVENIEFKKIDTTESQNQPPMSDITNVEDKENENTSNESPVQIQLDHNTELSTTKELGNESLTSNEPSGLESNLEIKDTNETSLTKDNCVSENTTAVEVEISKKEIELENEKMEDSSLTDPIAEKEEQECKSLINEHENTIENVLLGSDDATTDKNSETLKEGNIASDKIGNDTNIDSMDTDNQTTNDSYIFNENHTDKINEDENILVDPTINSINNVAKNKNLSESVSINDESDKDPNNLETLKADISNIVTESNSNNISHSEEKCEYLKDTLENKKCDKSTIEEQELTDKICNIDSESNEATIKADELTDKISNIDSKSKEPTIQDEELTDKINTIDSKSNEATIEEEKLTDKISNIDSKFSEPTLEEQKFLDKTNNIDSENLKMDSSNRDHNNSNIEKLDTKLTENIQSKTKLNDVEQKRKLSTDDDIETDICRKKSKLDEVGSCIRPRSSKKIHKGATFWPSNFRQNLCTCNTCLSMYKDLSVLFLIDLEDTATAYANLGQEKVGTEGHKSQYEKGLEALLSLDRIQQINAVTEYNKLRDKLLDFLKSFKDRQVVVKEEDIRAFFADMKPKRESDGVYFCR